MSYQINSHMINAILEEEGGYVNDPDDQGGETYCGIARKHHPGWPGWQTVDAAQHKDSLGLRESLMPALQAFWLQYLQDNHVDRVPEVLQYQYAQVVATSPRRAMAALQQLCVWSMPLLPQSFVDGHYGPNTALNIDNLLTNPRNTESYQSGYAIAAIAQYAEAAQHASNLKFLHGWILRTIRSWQKAKGWA